MVDEHELSSRLSFARRHRLLIDASLNAIVVFDDRSQILLVNSAAESLFGYAQGELSDQLFEAIIPHALTIIEQTELFKNFNDAIPVVRYELSGLRKDQTKITLDVGFTCTVLDGLTVAIASVNNIGNSESELSLMSHAAKLEITQLTEQLESKRIELEKSQHKAEDSKRALAQTVLEFKALAETVPAIVWTTNSEGQVDYINANWEKYTGHPVDSANDMGWASAVLPEDQERALRHWVDCCKNVRPYKQEFQLIAKDGTYRWYLSQGAPLLDHHGKVLKWFGICSDIDDQKRLLSELAEALEKANEATRLKSVFLANMSHEIRTPMNGIIGLSHVLLKTNLDSTQRMYVENLRQGSKTLLAVLNDILDLSKMEAGHVKLEMNDFSLVQVVESICDLFTATARPKGLSLMANIDQQIPSTLRGDSARLRQILTNLTSNAIKFSDRGEVVIRADVESIISNIYNLRFSVSDQGIGLSQEEQAKLFQPFAQADDSISRKYGGTGLGLSICKRLVELMGGTISVESVPEKGSNFSFTVALKKSDESPIALGGQKLHHVRALLVHQDSQERQIILGYMENWGLRTAVTNSLAEALISLRQASAAGAPFDIAIIDVEMAQAAGVELVEATRNCRTISDTKLILLVDCETPAFLSSALDFSCIALLTKPVRQSAMLESILRIMQASQTSTSKSVQELTSSPSDNSAKRKALILVAEDHPLNQKVAQLYLDELGFPAHIVSNGGEAIEAVANTEYSLVLMDCQMPEIDGFSATRAIREAEKLSNKHIPIIAMTAHSMSGDRERCLEVGMDDYIAKPVEPEHLRKLLEKWLPVTQ